MPLTKCSSGGKSGFRWGQSGKCYIGPSAKRKALAQGYAENPQGFKQEMSKSGLLEDVDVQAVIRDSEPAGADWYIVAVAEHIEKTDAYISADERKKIPLEDFADKKNRKFPIQNQRHLDAAVKLLGRESAGTQTALKARIKEIAKRKNLKLPASWSDQ